jgi:imidazolonepropionase-like amidohydrolase
MHVIILTNANLVDLDSPPQGMATITIVDERIESVDFGPEPNVPADATVIDVAGRWVMPGMFNCHFHAAYPGLHSYGSLFQRGLPPGMDAPPALQAIQAGRNLNLALQAGFTSVLSAGGPYNIDASLKIAVESGVISGARLMPGSRVFCTTGHSQDNFFPWHWEPGVPPDVVTCDGPDEHRKGVRYEIKCGAEIIKVFATGGHGVPSKPERAGLTREEFAAITDAAHQRGAKVRAHIAHKAGILLALDVGVDLIDHADGLDDECIDRIAEAGAFVTPSLLYVDRVTKSRQGPEIDIMRSDMERMLEILPKANAAGVKFLLGDDFGGSALEHGEYGDELDYYVNVAGLSAKEVLRWATRHGAEMMGRGDELGVISPGAVADLLVLDGDPIADIRVLKDGQKIAAILKEGVFEKNEIALPSAGVSGS